MNRISSQFDFPSPKRLCYTSPIDPRTGRLETVRLEYVPYSKSYMIRVFALAFLSGSSDLIEVWRGESKSCQDIDYMREALLALGDTDTKHIPVGSAGAVWRFLTAIAALSTDRPIMFKGTSRLFARPIDPLIESLQLLGANIDFDTTHVEQTTIFPSASRLHGGEIASEVGENSSQFLSALMLIAPYLSSPLKIHIHKDQRSKPYINLTYSLIEKAGAKISEERGVITIEPSQYDRAKVEQLLLHPETDWTAVSYPMGWCAIPEAPQSIFIPNCYRESLQGDIVLSKVMESFGVRTRFFPTGILIERVGNDKIDRLYDQDLSDNIDLVPTLFTTCLALGRPFRFRRIGALRYKESDRISSLIEMASRLGYQVIFEGEELRWDGTPPSPMNSPITINPHEDHRIAMALTVFTFKKEGIYLEDPSVVEKSYTHFWEDAKSVGITLVDN